MLVLAILTMSALALADVDVTIQNHWVGGFQGEICFSISDDMQGWRIHLHCDQALNSVEIWNADIAETSADNMEFVLVNKDYNGEEHGGDQLCLGFQGHGSGDISPTCTASLESAADGGVFHSTARPQTTASLGPGETVATRAPVTYGPLAGNFVTVNGTDLVHMGTKVFLSGANTAWVAYGYDFGNSQYQYRRSRYLYLLDHLSQSGGNSMRTWIHIEGSTSPEFDDDGFVTALDKDGTFISDFRKYLDDALQRNILVFPTLWNGALKQNFHYRLQGLITNTSKLQTYLDNALIPWVNGIKDHPALGGWDIINEMEGIIKPGVQDSEPCFDTSFLTGSGAGWAGATYTAEQFLRFINWQVDAIRRTDPKALVTAGSWSQKDQSDQFGDKNLYKDECLTKAGGKDLGTLTFYSTHTYSWQGKFASDATFLHNAADYQLDKPLVIAEFNSVSGAGMTIEEQFNYAYTHGYSGAWSWHFQADGGNTDSTETQMRGIAALRNKTGPGGMVALTLV